MNDSRSDESIVFLGTESVRETEKECDMKMVHALKFFL